MCTQMIRTINYNVQFITVRLFQKILVRNGTVTRKPFLRHQIIHILLEGRTHNGPILALGSC